MAVRFPLQVRRAPEFEAQVREWERTVLASGPEARLARQRLKEIRRLESLFPRKPFLGDHLEKQRIPKEFLERGVGNLFRVELPGFWRLLYTILEVDARQAVVELRALSHPQYDRLFGYRKK